MSAYRKLFKNLGMLFFSKILNVILSIAVISILSRYFGVELFGKYSFAMDFIWIFVSIVKFGLAEIVIRQIAVDKQNAGKNISVIVGLRIIFIAASAIAIIVITSALDAGHEVKIAVYLTMVSEFIFTFVNLWASVFIAYERAKFVPILMVTNRLVLLIFVCLIVFADWGFYPVFIAAIAANTMSALVGGYLVCTKFVMPKVSFNTDRMKYFLAEAAPVAISAVLIELSFRMDTFFLKALKGFDEVAYYGAPLRLIIRLSIIAIVLANGMLPVLSRLAKSSYSEHLTIAENSYKILIIILLPVCILSSVFAGGIVTVIFGEKFIASAPSLQIFIWVLLFFSSMIFMANILISINRQNVLSIVILLGLCLNVILDYVLIPGYGHVGAVVSKFISFALMALIIFYFVAHNIKGFRITESFLRPVSAAIVMAVIMYLLKDFNYLAAILAGFMTYGLSLFVFKAVSVSEMKNFRRIIRGASP